MLDFFNESIRCVPMDSVPTQFRNFCSLCIGDRRAAKQTGAILPSPWPSSRRALWLMLCTLLPLSSLMVEAAEQETAQGPTAASTPATAGDPSPPRRRWNNLKQTPRLPLLRPTQPSSRLADWELPLRNLIQARPSALITQCPSLSISNRD